MTVRHLLSGAALAAATTLLFAGNAQAQNSLTPGNTATTPTLSFAGRNSLAERTSSFDVSNGTQRIQGSLLSAVFQNGSTLDFFYQITTTSVSNSGIGSFSITSFQGVDTSVGETADDIDLASPFVAGVVTSDFVRREATGEGLTFFLTNNVNTSSSSYAQLVRTNATTFSFNGQAAVLGSGVAANLNTNVIAANPPGVAPEPGSLALVATGLMGAMGMVARRRRSAK